MLRCSRKEHRFVLVRVIRYLLTEYNILTFPVHTVQYSTFFSKQYPTLRTAISNYQSKPQSLGSLCNPISACTDPKNATRWFSVFADNEASRLDRYYISFSVSFLKYPGDVIHAFVGNPRFWSARDGRHRHLATYISLTSLQGYKSNFNNTKIMKNSWNQ